MRRAGQVLILVLCIISICAPFLHAQTTHNLEILFRKSYDPYPDSVWDFGRSISSAGDLNADGLDDIVIGAATVVDTPWVWMGLAYIFFGGSPMDTVPDLILQGGLPFGMYGFSVSSAGDLNGDGYDDVMVGAPNADVFFGKVYIYFGGPSLDTVPDLVLWGRPSGGDIGDALSYAGDVNGDGWDDIVTGGAQGFGLSGQVLIYFGGPALDTIPDVALYGQNSEGFGMSVGGGGDVDSDGYDDVVVGAWDNDEAYGNAGKIYVYLGGDPMDTTPDVWMHGEGTNQHLGWDNVSIALTSGYDWVITGTSHWPYGFPNYAPGKLYVLFGGSPMDSIPDVCVAGQTDTSTLGQWSSGAGRAAIDSADDVLAGAPIEFGRSGSVYLWMGDTLMDTIPDAFARGSAGYSEVGWRVASAGDVDLDGVDEIMFSSYAADSLTTVWVCRYTGTGTEEISDIGYRMPDAGLLQSLPNPFTRMTQIRYRIAVSGSEGPGPISARLGVHDIAGRLVRTLVDEEQERGEWTATWDGTDDRGRRAPSGVYFCRLSVAGKDSGSMAAKKLILLR